MKNCLIYLILIVFSFFSCTRQHRQNTSLSFNPAVASADGYVVPDASVSSPKATLAGKPKVLRAGKPNVVYANPNVYPAEEPKVILCGNPRIITPGQDSFLLPKTVVAINNPFVAGIPEVVIAKDAYIKDQNPQNFSSFSTLQGLKHNKVRCLLQDKSGNLWFGTYGGGVSKYDGKSFTHFTQKEGLCNNLVLSMLQDNSGNLWFGAEDGGVSKYDGKCFTNFTMKEGLSNNKVYSILQDKSGFIWFGTGGGGVSKYDGKCFTHYTQKQGLTNNTVWSIFEDKSGNLWFGSLGGGVSKFDGKSFTNFTEKEGLCNNYILAIIQDNAGNLWFGSDGGGVSKYDGKYFTHFTEKQGLSNNLVWSILQDKNGDFWFATFSGGISKFDGKSFTHFTEKEGLPNNHVISILQDKSENLWFGTFGGVCKYNGKSFTHFTEKEGLKNNNVYCILKDKSESLWFGSYGGGVSKFDGKSFTHFTEKEGLTDNYVCSIYQDKDENIWFGAGSGGVSKFDGKCFTNFTQKEGLVSNSILAIIQDKSGNLWFGAYGGGVSKFDGKSFTNFTEKDGLSSDKVLSIFQDNNGNIWFGTLGGGVSKLELSDAGGFHGNSNLPKSGFRFTRYSQKEGLANNNVHSILQDKDGNIWFATGGGGISRYDGKTFTNFTEKEGLVNNYVFSILQDHKGNLWFGTRFGLSKLKLENLKAKATNPELPLFKNYTYEDGFLGIGCNRGAICEDSAGNIWIGAIDRLTTYHPDGDYRDAIPPNIQLTGIELFNENIDWANLLAPSAAGERKSEARDTSILLGNGIAVTGFRFDETSKWYGLPRNLSLKYNNNFLTFTFIGITQKQSNKVKYQYKLEGLDKNWSVPTLRNEAPYGNLPPGNYSFKIKAGNSEGFWSNEFIYSFNIRPPWWKTWWFRVLLAILIFGSLFSFYRLRIASLKKQQKHLERIVEEKTAKVVKQSDDLQIINEELTLQKEAILAQKEQLQFQNDKLHKMDEFKQRITSMIVHDLKNPLNIILNIPRSFAPERKIAIMQQSGNQMLNLVLNILDVYKYEEVEMKLELKEKQFALIAVNALKQVQLLYEQKEITLENETDYGLVTLAEEEIVERVLVNLLTNAIKYTPTGGTITLSTNQLSEDMVKISVSDNGEGIPNDKIHLVFQKFGQIAAKNSGNVKSTGLGLTFCKMAVEAHGGEIGLNSEVGKGTTFWFTLQLGKTRHVKIPTIDKEIKIEKVGLYFTEEEGRLIEPIIDKLKTCTIYETDDIEEILAPLAQNKSENIQKWLSKIEKNIVSLNQPQFLELLKIT